MAEAEEVPTIQAERVTLELIYEGDFVGPFSSVSDVENIARFPVLASIQREIEDVVRKKLLQSVALKRYEVSKEIEWLEKLIGLLEQREVNNHTDNQLQSPVEHQQKLESAQRRLQNLQTMVEEAEENDIRADEVLDGQLDQIRIVLPNFPIDKRAFQQKHQSWKFAIGSNFKLQRIQRIGERIWTIEEKLEVEFWVAELKRVVEELDEEKKRIAVGLLIELAFWRKQEHFEPTVPFSDVFDELMGAILLQEHFKDTALLQLRGLRNTEQGSTATVELLAAMFSKLQTNEFREKLGTLFCEEAIRVMDQPEWIVCHGECVIAVLESVVPQLGFDLLDSFDEMFVLLNTAICRDSGLLRERVLSVLRYRRDGPVRPTHLPTLGASLSPQTARNVDVTEHSTSTETAVQRREEDGFLKRKSEEMRLKIEEEFKRKEQETRRIEEQRQREKELERAERWKREEQKRREERERTERIQRKLQETIRLQEQELKLIRTELDTFRREERERRKREDAERRRIQKEEEAKRIRKEEETRKKEEEEKRKREEDRRKENLAKFEMILQQVRAEEERKKEERKKEERTKGKDRRKERIQAEEEAKGPAVETEQKRIDELMEAAFLVNFPHFGTNPPKIYNHNVLNEKIIGLLFAGSKSRQCQEFMPKLNKFYNNLVRKRNFEVVFISLDESESEMDVFLQEWHCPWFYLPFRSQIGEALKTSLNITSVPQVIIGGPNGQVITMHGVAAIENCCKDCDLIHPPFIEIHNCEKSTALVEQWKSMLHVKK